eukprot:5833217-Prymnesium_polylepis.2
MLSRMISTNLRPSRPISANLDQSRSISANYDLGDISANLIRLTYKLNLSPIAKFAPAGSMYTVRTLNPIRAQRPSHPSS